MLLRVTLWTVVVIIVLRQRNAAWLRGINRSRCPVAALFATAYSIMKSWKKLKELARFKDKSNNVEPTQDIEEITKGMQDVHDMRVQYEGLHAVSSRVAGRAYGFSEAIQEMATFLVNSFDLVDDNEEISQVFKEAGRAQSELSRLLHLYAYHVSETLTLPTESLLNELDHIEDTKKQYDEKRHSYGNLRLRKSKSKSTKTEAQVDQQLQEAKEHFDELVMFLECRLHSLEQSRPRNLITQATRHHAAQMHLFKQGLSCLEDINPYIDRLIQDRNLDQTLGHVDREYENNINVHADFKAEESDHSSSSEQGAGSTKQRREDPRTVTFGAPPQTGSKSAPISPIRFSEARGVNSIHEVMLDGKFTPFRRTNSWVRRKASRDPGILQLYRPDQGKETAIAAQSSHPYSVTEPRASPVWKKSAESAPVLKTSNLPWPSSNLPWPSTQRGNRKLSSFPSFPRHFANSGPLVSATKPRQLVPNSGPVPQAPAVSMSGPLHPSPKISPSVSPPRVSELHKLPPPPLGCPASSTKMIPHSAPLGRPAPSTHASPLPPPPLVPAMQPASPVSKGQKPKPSAPLRKIEERVSPLPLTASTS